MIALWTILALAESGDSQILPTSLAAIAASFAGLLVWWVRTLLNRNEAEREAVSKRATEELAEQRAERLQVRAERIEELRLLREELHKVRDQVDDFGIKNSGLETKWVECEVHRKHQGQDIVRLSNEIIALKLELVDVKSNLAKIQAIPVTMGTPVTVDPPETPPAPLTR